MARSVHVPARGEAAAELLGLALRDPLLAAWSRARPRRGLERPPAPVLRPRRAGGVRLAPRARPPAWPRARGRAGVRDRAVPGRAERRPPARADLDPDPASLCGPSSGPGAEATGGSSPPAPRSRRSRFPDRCISRSVRSRSSSPTRSAGPATRACCSVPSEEPWPRVGAGALVRELVIRHSTQAGGRSLDEISFYSAQRRRLRLAARRPFAERAVRLPRVGHSARRDPRARSPAPRAPLFARRDSRARSGGAGRAGARHAHAALLSDLARAAAFSFSARAGAAAADRVSLHRGALCLCDRAGSAQHRRGARRCASPRRPARARLRQVRSRRSGGRSAVGGGTPARATRVRSRRPLRKRVPLVRHGRPETASRRLLDDGAKACQEPCGPAAAAQLR